MQIKMVNEDVTYYEKTCVKTFVVNGKTVKICLYIKQDSLMGNYDNDYKFIQGKELLNEDEMDDLMDIVFDLK